MNWSLSLRWHTAHGHMNTAHIPLIRLALHNYKVCISIPGNKLKMLYLPMTNINSIKKLKGAQDTLTLCLWDLEVTKISKGKLDIQKQLPLDEGKF